MKEYIYWNEIKINIIRSVRSYKLLWGIAGVFLSLLFASFEIKGDKTSVIFVVRYIVDGIPFYLCMTFCAVPFAESICEDMEFNFHKVQIIRRNLKSYTTAKVFVIFFTAVISMMSGILLFIVVLRINLPWTIVHDSVLQISIESGGLRSLLVSENFVLYYLLISFQLGVFAGCLSLTASVFSLFVKNKLLVYTVPVMVLYLITNFTWRIPAEFDFLNIYKVFNPYYSVWQHDVWSFVWANAIGLFTVSGLGTMIFYKIRRMTRNE